VSHKVLTKTGNKVKEKKTLCRHMHTHTIICILPKLSGPPAVYLPITTQYPLPTQSHTWLIICCRIKLKVVQQYCFEIEGLMDNAAESIGDFSRCKGKLENLTTLYFFCFFFCGGTADAEMVGGSPPGYQRFPFF
jgi:hypothetical protein